MKLLTILDEANLLWFFGMRLEVIDSAIGRTIRDQQTREIIQIPPEVLMASLNDKKRVRTDKLNNLMAERDHDDMERDERIKEIIRPYRRMVLYFLGKKTGVDYVEYPEPERVYRNGDIK